MQIWLDTIDCDTIEDAAKRGVLAGVTTNPSILAQTNNVPDTLQRILDIQHGPVAVQVTSPDPLSMVEEARSIFEFSPRMIVKVPVNRNGLVAMKQLKKENIPVMGTGVLFSHQVLLASNVGIAYLAPYFSHIGDIGDAFGTLETMVNLLKTTRSSTKMLAASLKQLDHLIFCATLGVDAVTLKPDLYYKLVADQPVVEGFFERFLDDWTQTHGPISIKQTLQAYTAASS